MSPAAGRGGAGDDDDDDPVRARLVGLARRIDVVATDPDAVRAPWTRLVRPVLRRIGARPRVETAALTRLLDALRARNAPPREPAPPDAAEQGDDAAADADEAARDGHGAATGDRDAAPARSGTGERALGIALEATLAELERSVGAVERACVVNRRPQVAYAAWLRRLLGAIARAHAASRPDAPRALVRVACATEHVALLPPLGLRVAREDDDDEEVPDAAAPGAGTAAVDDVESAARVDPGRLLELELGAVDHLLAAARDETELLSRRRRLLEAARQLLLEASAALPLEATGVEARRAHIARSITRIDRLEAAGLAPDVALVHQARGAAARGERDRLHAALVALDDAALARGDIDTAARTGTALARMWEGQGDPHAPLTRGRSVLRSAQQALGREIVRDVERAYARGRSALDVRDDGGAGATAGGEIGAIAEAYAASRQRAKTALDREEERRAREYLAPEGIDATLAAAVAVDGCFEVGGVLAPVRVTEHEVRVRAVRHPTAELLLAEARDVADVPAAVIDDPRMVLLDLAAGRLLTRRYVAREPHPRTRTVLRGEVRIYVLDGSGSMIGPRARVRDALLLAELATLIGRLNTRERSTRVVLFYRYFNDKVGPTTRVDTVAAAREAIADVLACARFGGTDIEAALVASFEQVRQARAADPDLARAQIVLLTDGEAAVREEIVARAQAGTAGLPVGLSVIALGAENEALRTLVARQRARGERAFYHFIGDEALGAMVAGEQDTGAALHLPDDAPEPSVAYARQLTETVGALLDEVASLGRTRDLEALEALEHEARARREVGLAGDAADDADAAQSLSEGERARIEALHRDRRALARRFARWFPEPSRLAPRGPTPSSLPSSPPRSSRPTLSPASSRGSPPAGSPERADLDATVVALATVAEVITVVGGSELARQADAIDLLERLLPDAHLSPTRYEGVLARHADAVAPPLRAVHDAVRFGLGGGARVPPAAP